MEKKTNKAKLEIFKFLRKSAESQGYSLDKISRNFVFYGNSINRVFLHSEFISTMRTVQNNKVFMKTQK